MQTEVFLVLTNRADGKLPNSVKTLKSQLFFLQEDAEAKARQINKEIGKYFGVYRGLIEITDRVEIVEKVE